MTSPRAIFDRAALTQEGGRSRDILLMTRVDKPALLRRLFQLGCEYSSQILSCQKMLGQLQEAGHTVTLAHYLQLLQGAGMFAGLEKYSRGAVRVRDSSPKLQVMNTALATVYSPLSLDDARANGDYWGRLVESAVAAHLLRASGEAEIQVTYWRERNHEVDFVLTRGKTLVAIEVKSGRRRDTMQGMSAFVRQFEPTRSLVVGGQGIALDEFLTRPPTAWL